MLYTKLVLGDAAMSWSDFDFSTRAFFSKAVSILILRASAPMGMAGDWLKAVDFRTIGEREKEHSTKRRSLHSAFSFLSNKSNNTNISDHNLLYPLFFLSSKKTTENIKQGYFLPTTLKQSQHRNEPLPSSSWTPSFQSPRGFFSLFSCHWPMPL